MEDKVKCKCGRTTPCDREDDCWFPSKHEQNKVRSKAKLDRLRSQAKRAAFHNSVPIMSAVVIDLIDMIEEDL